MVSILFMVIGFVVIDVCNLLLFVIVMEMF